MSSQNKSLDEKRKLYEDKRDEVMSRNSRHYILMMIFFILAVGGFIGLFIKEGLGVTLIFISLGVLVVMFFNYSSMARDSKDTFYQLVNYTKSKLEDDFNIDKEYISMDSQLCLFADETNNRICFFENLKDYFDINKYTYEDILEVEIIEDGKTLTKTNRGSQIGGALLGSVLAGGVGGVVGGLSASTTSESKVSSLCLRVVVNDTDNPVKTIYFLKNNNVNKNDVLFIESKEKIDYWYSLLKVYINKADKKDETNIKNTSPTVADELKKFSELFADGYITEEEYNAEKGKLLNRVD